MFFSNHITKTMHFCLINVIKGWRSCNLVFELPVELIETCKNLTRTCGESKGTSRDLNKTYKIFLLCFTIATLVFDTNSIGGFTPNCLKLC